MPEADETIITRFGVEANEFLQKLLEIRDITDETTKKLAELATVHKASFKEAAEVMVVLKKEALDLQKSLEPDPKLRKQIAAENKKELNEYTAQVKKSLSELTRADREYFKKQKELDRGATKSRLQELQERVKAQRAANKEASAAQREYTKITKQGFGVMSAAAQQYGQQIQKIKGIIQRTAQSSGQSWDKVGQRMARHGVALDKVNIALRELNSQTKQSATGLQGFISKITNLGGVGKLVFGSILGVGAVQALRRVTRAFVDFAKEILQRGTEMTEVIFTLEVAIRGLQRIGLDTTIAGWTERIQELKKEFPFFPKREFMEAASLAALMTREFGFTEKQIAEIVRQSSILAQITGKDLLESVRGITFAIGSGYFESLQRAGVNISRAVVKNEALAQGYTGVYNELEPTIRASVTYSVIQKNLASIQDDASRKVETSAGQVQILTSRMEDLKNLFGQVVTASDSLIETLETLNELLGAIQEVYEALAGFDIDIFAPMKELLGLNKIIEEVEILTVTLTGLARVINGLAVAAGGLGAVIGALGTIADALGMDGIWGVSEGLNSIAEALTNISRSLGDLPKEDEIEIPFKFGDIELTPEEYEEVIEATQELQDELLEIEEDAAKKRIDIMEDWARDTADIRKKHHQKMEDLEEDHQRRLDDIDLKAQQKRDDAIANYEFRVADAIRDAAFRRQEAERKYRERELKEEKRFQEKLRQLRENFLLDLEDAVRERDARQIIRLTRQFNLRRKQMIREGKIGEDERADAFQEELRQIELQKQERLRQLAVEHARRLEAIDLQAQREREREAVEFLRRQEAERVRWEQQKTDREKRRDEQLADLEQGTQDRVNKVLEGLEEEYGLTEAQLKVIGELWEQYYGAGGVITQWVDQGIDYTIARLQQLMAFQQAVIARQFIGRSITPRGGFFGQPEFAGEQAEGGTIIARKPTVAIFGEAGDEMATFTPLNKLGANAPQVSPMDAGQITRSGRMRLELLLPPDWKARIIDDTLGEIADVNFTVERARK